MDTTPSLVTTPSLDITTSLDTTTSLDINSVNKTKLVGSPSTQKASPISSISFSIAANLRTSHHTPSGKTKTNQASTQIIDQKSSSDTKLNYLPSTQMKLSTTSKVSTLKTVVPKLAGMMIGHKECKSCICVGMYQQVSMKNLSQSLIKIKESLLLSTKNLSSSKRRRTSAGDNRQSAADLGYIGLAVIASCVGWIVSSDIIYLLALIKELTKKVRCQTK